MEILDRKKSEEMLSKLFHKLGRTDPKYLKKYFNGRYFYFKIFNCLISLNFSSLPLLWSPQKRGEKDISGVYEDIAEFKTYMFDPKDKKYKSIVSSIILRRLISFLEKEKKDFVYSLAEIYLRRKIKPIRNMIIKAKPSEIVTVIGEMEGERYFFPQDFSWLFGITHEDFCFLAGKENFVRRFKSMFKDHPEIFLKQSMLRK